MPITNALIKDHVFLEDIGEDDYFPPDLVDKGRRIFQRLCAAIEAEKPESLPELYVLTGVATEEFNELANEFADAGSEIETAARENIAGDFEFVARAYGFDADTEDMIAARDW